MNNPTTKPSQLDRREALQTVGATVALAAAAGAQGLTAGAHAATPSLNVSDRAGPGFWPNGARLAVSLSLMFEGGGQPISGAGGVIPDPIEKGVPDLPTNAFFAYGHYEGIPRVLDLMDKHGIKLSSFMIGKAVETSPVLWVASSSTGDSRLQGALPSADVINADAGLERASSVRVS